MKRDKLTLENDFFGTESISRILFKIAPHTAAAGTR